MMTKIVSPPHRTIYQKDNWYLFFDPTSLTWVKVNKDGKKILSEIEHFPDYTELSVHLKQKYETDEATIEQFVSFMIEKARYLHKEEYHPRSITFSPKNIIPKKLYVHPTYRCNMNCVYCYNKKDRQYYIKNKSYHEMTVEDYRVLFQQAGQLGIDTVIFSGGEPLLRQDIFKIARVSKELGLKNSIITNGTLITGENAAAIIRYFDQVSVSIDSHIPAENDRMRGKNSFKPALRGIRYLRDLNKQVSCLGVTHPGNIDDVMDSWDYFVNKLGFSTFVPQAYIPIEAAKNDLPGLFDFAVKYAAIRSRINSLNKIESQKSFCNNCGICSDEIAIGADGNVFPCQSLLKDEFRGGNVITAGLKDILENSPVLNRLRALTVDEIEGCKACEVKYICGGGCRAKHLDITGDVMKNNRFYCTINKEITIDWMFKTSNVPGIGIEQ